MQIDDTATRPDTRPRCEICQQPFTPPPPRRGQKPQRFCSRACSQESWKHAVQPQASDKGAVTRWGSAPQAPPTAPTPDDDRVWAERGRLWSQRVVPVSPDTLPTRKRRSEPVVVAGHGVRFNIEQGALVIRNGFTHYPHTPEVWRFYPSDRLPARIVVCDADGSLSFDVLTWCSERDIPMIWLNWRGEVVTVGGDPGLSRDVHLAQAQLRLLQSGQALTVAIDLIRQKVQGCRETLAAGPEGLLNPSVDRVLRATIQGLDQDPPDTPEALRWREAQAAKAYFTAWRAIPLQWKATGAHPIPPAWRHLGPRLSSLTGTARQATHPVNALLNYAYGLLESQVRRALIIAGLDPTLGVLHASQPGRTALVYDVMEPLRPQVDRLVLTFLTEHVLHPKDFVRQADGVCRVHPQLARSIVGLALSEDRLTARVRRFIDRLMSLD